MQPRFLLAAAVLALGGLGTLGLATVSAVSGQPATAPVAALQSATFLVENMTCALCPITVRKAISQVPGVRSVEVDVDTKTARVAFDPSLTTVEAIAAASANAGYPASLKG